MGMGRKGREAKGWEEEEKKEECGEEEGSGKPGIAGGKEAWEKEAFSIV